MKERRRRLAARLVARLVRLIGSTWRIELAGEVPPPGARSLVICGWHGKSLPFALAFRDRGYVVMISRSNDGDLQNAVFSSLGFESVRGSSGRGGERALVAAIRALRDGKVMAMTPDGPRGPSGVVQPGVVLMAQRSGALLVPTGIAARPNRRARSWDRFLIPLPFARALIVFGAGVPVPPEADPETVARDFAACIDALEDEAARRLGLPAETHARQAAIGRGAAP